MENAGGVLTERKQTPRLGLLNHSIGLWESFGKRSIVASLSGGGGVPLAAAIEHLPAETCSNRVCHSRAKAPLEGRRGQASREYSRICAPMVMTENKRAQAAIPHQDNRNLSCLAWFSSPRGTTSNTKFRREMKPIWRISHGSARSIEGLRGVRLSLVPGPDPRECVLQGMRVKTERLSIAGEPKAARTPGSQAVRQGLGGG